VVEVAYLSEAALATLPGYGYFKLSDSVMETRSEVRNVVMCYFLESGLLQSALLSINCCC
jgi:GTP-binding protein EngB required for normal cell division